jgi:hypothetical protein
MTFREAVVQVLLITVGVLIALGFDQVTAWRDHRALVREARANLTNEIRDNRQELDGTLKELRKSQQQLAEALDLLQLLIEKKTPELRSVQLSAPTSGLADASRRTAEITGAFGYMPYDEVKKYASLYGYQDQVIKLQQQFVTDVTRALADVPVFAEPERSTPIDFEDAKRHLRQALSSSEAQKQVSEQLLRQYDRVLQGN